MTQDQKRILELENENCLLKTEMARLKALVETLVQEIERLKHPKNSRNSSVPPSKDENRPLKTKSLRISDGKLPGGQIGHEGNTLKMTDCPDFTQEHMPTYCNHCGNDLSERAFELVGCRQLVDIPPIIPRFTEHRIFKATCSCGHQTTSSYPQGVNAPISYGPGIEATIAYLHTRQYIPFERMGEYFRDVCNLPISQGAICDILERFASKAKPAYQLVAKAVEGSKVVGSDETGAKINGTKGWFWTWQTRMATFIAFSKNRGTATIQDHFANGFIFAVLVHDCWKSHFQIRAKTHQVCIAHLLRELAFFEERYHVKWATLLKELLLEALKLKDQLTPADYLNPINERTDIIQRFLILLQTPIDPTMKDLCAFQKRMNRYQDFVFTFLFYPDVPPDNNASERAIRNVKVKQKVSGQFKTQRGAEIYAIIRSVTDTCIKNGQNILAAFQTIAKLRPE